MLFCYWARIDDEAVRSTVKTLVEEIQLNLQKLTHLTQHRGNSFMSKWKKKSKDARAALIKDAAPGIAETTASYFEFCYSRPEPWVLSNEMVKRRANRWMLLLPWLNLEVLKDNSAALFALVHYRTSHSPASWAAWDSRQLDTSWTYAHFDSEFSAKCIAIYEGSFGNVVDFDPGRAHSGATLGYP